MSEAWSRRIKLFSGYMMIALAISMLLRPWVFTSLGETLQLIATSVAVTLLTILAYERGLSRHGRKLSL
jgi:hypothetical protein